MMKINALEKRPFRFKNSRVDFLCPLCRSERSLTTCHKLMLRHYVQITFLTALTTFLLYPVASLRGSLVFFFYWAVFEFFRRAEYRNEVPCPYCGFDAVWYKRDVKKAKHKVDEFWGRDQQVPQGEELPENFMNTSQNTQSVESQTQF